MSRRYKRYITARKGPALIDGCSVTLLANSYTHEFKSIDSMTAAVRDRFLLLKAARPADGESVHIPGVGSVHVMDDNSAYMHLTSWPVAKTVIQIYAIGYKSGTIELTEAK